MEVESGTREVQPCGQAEIGLSKCSSKNVQDLTNFGSEYLPGSDLGIGTKILKACEVEELKVPKGERDARAVYVITIISATLFASSR